MRIAVATRFLHKAGNEPEEYEDAFWPPSPGVYEAYYFRAAVADGATETSFSGRWAAELVRAYGTGKLDHDRPEAGLPRLRRRWRTRIDERRLPWYAQEKLRQGAFSSLLGLRLIDVSGRDGSGFWQSLAIGDTCLFHLRGGSMRRAFPICHSSRFSNRPRLVSSFAAGDAGLEISRVSGRWRTGDRFLLMTDALAQWYLGRVENGSVATDAIADSGFASWISELRGAGHLRNDDVTAMSIALL